MPDSSILDLLDSASLVSKTDKQGKITFVNQKFMDVSGYTEAELVGKTHALVNSGHHSKAFWKDFWATIGKGGTWTGDVKNKKKNGQYYWVQTHASPERDKEGNITGYIAIRHDVTKEKEAQEQLLELKNDAEQNLQDYRLESKRQNTQHNYLYVLHWTIAGTLALTVFVDVFTRADVGTIAFLEKAFIYFIGLLSGVLSPIFNRSKESFETETTTTKQKTKSPP